MIQINESGMVFEFEDEKVFQIEDSDLHLKFGEGIKTVEFLVSFKENELFFVEAKSSSPRPKPENEEKFDDFIKSICEKFLHSFNMYLTVALKRNAVDESNKNFFENHLELIKFKFVLIIKGHKEEWLLPLKDAFCKSLNAHMKIWDSQVMVLNENLAQKYHFVKEY